jgi:hypothetical protein
MNKVCWQSVLHHLIVDLFALHVFYLTAGGKRRVKNTIDASEEAEKSDSDEEEDEDDDTDDLCDLKNVLQSDDESTENEG